MKLSGPEFSGLNITISLRTDALRIRRGTCETRNSKTRTSKLSQHRARSALVK